MYQLDIQSEKYNPKGQTSEKQQQPSYTIPNTRMGFTVVKRPRRLKGGIGHAGLREIKIVVHASEICFDKYQLVVCICGCVCQHSRAAHTSIIYNRKKVRIYGQTITNPYTYVYKSKSLISRYLLLGGKNISIYGYFPTEYFQRFSQVWTTNIDREKNILINKYNWAYEIFTRVFYTQKKISRKTVE